LPEHRFSSIVKSTVSKSLIKLAFASSTALLLGGCGGTSATVTAPTPRPSAGSIHAIVQGASGQSRTLAVDYAAAGLSQDRGGANVAPGVTSDGDGSLVLVGVFRDGRVDDTLDLETLSISIPLSELPSQTGSLDVVVDGRNLSILLEGSANSETRVITPDLVRGNLHMRYDAPPRPGITLRGDFSLTVDAAGSETLHLDGEFEVPVLGG
jgi:hypothetical protein